MADKIRQRADRAVVEELPQPLKAVELIERLLAKLHELREYRPYGWPIRCITVNADIRNISRAMQEVVDDSYRYVHLGTVERKQRVAQRLQTLFELCARIERELPEK